MLHWHNNNNNKNGGSGGGDGSTDQQKLRNRKGKKAGRDETKTEGREVSSTGRMKPKEEGGGERTKPRHTKNCEMPWDWLKLSLYPYEAIVVIVFVLVPVLGLVYYAIQERNIAIKNTLSDTYKDFSTELANTITQCIMNVETMHKIQCKYMTVDDTFVRTQDPSVLHREALRYANTLNAFTRSSGFYVIRRDLTLRGVLKHKNMIYFSDTKPDGMLCQYAVELPSIVNETPYQCFNSSLLWETITWIKPEAEPHWNVTNSTDVQNAYMLRSGVYTEDGVMRFATASTIIPADFELFLSHVNTTNDDFFIVDAAASFLVSSTLGIYNGESKTLDTGHKIFSEETIVPVASVNSSRVQAVHTYVLQSFGSWAAVPSTSYWDGRTIVSLEPITRDNGITWVLVTMHECDWIDMGTSTMLLAFALVAAAIIFLGAFVVFIAHSIRHISREMAAVATLNFKSDSDTTTTTTTTATTAVMQPSLLLPSNGQDKGKGSNKNKGHRWETAFPDLKDISVGTQKLRLCSMAMTQYISPFLTQDIINSSPGTLPTQKNITVMFVTLAELSNLVQLHKSRLQAVLNTFYKNFGEVISSCHGVIDKYINGSIMVLFGIDSNDSNNNPNTSSSGNSGSGLTTSDSSITAAAVGEMEGGVSATSGNEYNGCLAALMFHRAMETTNEELPNRERDLSYKVGIDCGKAYCGNIGYEDRANYTAWGPPVSVASRIEALTEIYGVSPLVSGEVVKRVRSSFHCVHLDTVYIKGHRKAATGIYHLLGVRGEDGVAAEERFHEIHKLIRENKLAEAHKLINGTCHEEKFLIYKRALHVLSKHVKIEKNFYEVKPPSARQSPIAHTPEPPSEKVLL